MLKKTQVARVLPMNAAGHEIDVVQHFLAREERLVAHLEAPQPLDAGHALHPRDQQTQRKALLGLGMSNGNLISRANGNTPLGGQTQGDYTIWVDSPPSRAGPTA